MAIDTTWLDYITKLRTQTSSFEVVTPFILWKNYSVAKLKMYSSNLGTFQISITKNEKREYQGIRGDCDSISL